MRRRPHRIAERGRVRTGYYASRTADGCTGAFEVGALCIIASDGTGWEEDLPPPPWEHVSVSLATRCPTWEEMALVKSWFWEPEELVIQLHPRESQYVNQHPYCLHLWRPVGVELPEPPPITVGGGLGRMSESTRNRGF